MAEKYINRHDLLKKLGTFNWNMMIMRPELFEMVVEKIIHYIFTKIEEFPYIEIENDKCIYGKWIPVTERLPELRMWESGSLASSNVLFVTEDKTIHIGYVMEDFHIGDNGCLEIDRWFMLGGDRIENVTHWMPLLEPPKEETDG